MMVVIVFMTMLVTMVMVMLVFVVMTVAMFVIMAVIVRMIMTTVRAVDMIMVVVAASGAVDMALWRVFVIQQLLRARCHIGILVRIKGIHAGQYTKAHGLDRRRRIVSTRFATRKLHEGVP